MSAAIANGMIMTGTSLLFLDYIDRRFLISKDLAQLSKLMTIKREYGFPHIYDLISSQLNLWGGSLGDHDANRGLFLFPIVFRVESYAKRGFTTADFWEEKWQVNPHKVCLVFEGQSFTFMDMEKCMFAAALFPRLVFY